MKRCAVALAASVALAALPLAAAAQQGEPVRIGLLLDMSSLYADITGIGSETAAKMAVEDFGGKVLGRPIEVLAADHQNKPDIASAKAREWFDNEHVDALLDVAASATALAAMNVAKEKNKIIVMSGPGASSITGEACIPTSVHWVYNTYALAHTTGKAVVENGGKSWFFIAADYAFGAQLEKDTADVVKASGGMVLGEVKAPLNTADFSSFLLQAQASKAKIIGLANAGGDFINAVKQAAEFGIAQGGQNLAGLLVYINDVHSLGLKATQGMMLSAAFYWDMNDATRAWSKRFFAKLGKMPNMSQAGVYSSTMHYLAAVKAAGTTATEPVMDAMRKMPVNDFFARNGHIRADGLMLHDMYLFQVKKPEESTGEWDTYKLVATVPGEEAFLPLAQSKCPLVKK
ncbi:MAG TPA: ABC transporter substrate-binding protein [Stellaceae bacterium]|nr:ABC transporter substrate-binding protein [Stellaceae bacterium]